MRIVFSYDCEGNWAFVDWVKGVLTDEMEVPLQNSYDKLLELHHRYKIPATFAFVALYAMNSDERMNYVDKHLSELAKELPNLRNLGGCWTGDKNFEKVVAAMPSPYVELGSHSLTHRPHDKLTNSDLVQEFDESRAILEQLSGAYCRSYVYPRNIVVGQKRCLKSFDSFRDTDNSTKVKRGRNLLSSLTGFEIGGTGQVLNDFVYWQSGARAFFSDARWKVLWEKRLRRAKMGKDKSKVIHVWSHPHNLVTDETVPNRIEWLLDRIDQHRDVVELSFLSQQ